MGAASVGIGALSIAALGKESTWGTGVAVDTVVPFKSEALERALEKLESEYLDGKPDIKNIQSGVQDALGSLEIDAVYDTIAGNFKGIDDFFLFALGAATYQTTGGYNEFSVTDNIDESFTLAFLQYSGVVWEAIGCKVNSLQLSGSARGKVALTANIIGKLLARTAESPAPTNAASALTALAPTATPTLVGLDDLVFRMDTLGAALAGADQLNISDFTLSFNNSLSDPQHATPVSGASSKYTLEPIRNGFREVTLSITFPRLDATSAAFINYHLDDTAVQADLKFSRGTNEINIYLPNCTIINPASAPIAGPGVFPLTLNLKAMYNDSNINGDMKYSGGISPVAITGPIGIETKNARTAAP